MPIQLIVSILSAIASDYATYEAGTQVTSPSVTVDLSGLGLGKAKIDLQITKSA